MRYLELKIQASEQGVEQITALLLGMGITEMSIDDPHDMDDILQKKHEYGWDYIEDDLKEKLDREPVISLYFDEADPKAQQMAVMVKGGISALQRRQQAGEFGQQADLGSLTVTENIVDDGDWKDKWKEFFKPTKVTDRIVVKPTWEEYTPKENELVIEIDPGMAFGTGTHETTSLCMKLMEKYLGEHSEEKKILDVGCGSGILSICGALLGSREILGIEIDEDAVRVARENVEENHVEDAVKVMQGDLTKGVDFKADVIVANLMADLVMLLSEDARKHLTEDGIFISSGILVEKEEMVSAAIREAGFHIVEIAEDGEWCAIAAVPEV